MGKYRFDEYLGPRRWKGFVAECYDYRLMLRLTRLKGCPPAAKNIALEGSIPRRCVTALLKVLRIELRNIRAEISRLIRASTFSKVADRGLERSAGIAQKMR